MRMPSASEVRPSSSPEHSMPLLTTPIFSVRSIRRSPGRTAPGRATGTRWPGAMFVAPHTMSSGSPVPHGHAGQRQPVRPRMLLDRQQLPDDDLLPVRAPALDALDLHAEQGQSLGEGLGRHVDVDELPQPAERDPHRNCSRSRRSFSMYSRRSPTP